MESPVRGASRSQRGTRGQFSPPRTASSLFGDSSPSSSPNRIRQLADQGLINQNTPAYRSAMEKINVSCHKFDRSKDGNLLRVRIEFECIASENCKPYFIWLVVELGQS